MRITGKPAQYESRCEFGEFGGIRTICVLCHATETRANMNFGAMVVIAGG